MASSTPSASEPFVVHHVTDVRADSAEPTWLVQNLWLDRGVGILGGPPKACKTFLAAEIACAVATGGPALGRHPVTAPGRVLFYGAEDSLPALARRFAGIASVRGRSLADATLYLLDVAALRLDRTTDIDRLRRTLDQHKVTLLVVDPFVRVVRIDENSANEVSAVLGTLREIQRELGIAVLIVHHARKAPSAQLMYALRGSSDFAAWSDTNMHLSRSAERLTLRIEHRSAPAPEPIALRLRTDPAPHLEVIDGSLPAATEDPLHAEILARITTAAAPVTTVALRAMLCRRKEDVVRGLLALEAERQVVRGAGGWTLPTPA